MSFTRRQTSSVMSKRRSDLTAWRNLAFCAARSSTRSMKWSPWSLSKSSRGPAAKKLNELSEGARSMSSTISCQAISGAPLRMLNIRALAHPPFSWPNGASPYAVLAENAFAIKRESVQDIFNRIGAISDFLVSAHQHVFGQFRVTDHFHQVRQCQWPYGAVFVVIGMKVIPAVGGHLVLRGAHNGWRITCGPHSTAETRRKARQPGAVKLMRVRRATALGSENLSENKAGKFMRLLARYCYFTFRMNACFDVLSNPNSS